MRDATTREAITSSRRSIDVAAVTSAWETALDTPRWTGPPTWVHGDVAAGNLIFRDGRLAALIDWACMAVGDPACELVVAWELLDELSRESFRAELAVDDATWDRGRGWVLSTASVRWPTTRTPTRSWPTRPARSSARCWATTPCSHRPDERRCVAALT
jgi:aminoglycoside phosphotransferase (APT) family kinase protein